MKRACFYKTPKRMKMVSCELHTTSKKTNYLGMKKTVLFSVLSGLLTLSAFSQQTLIYTHQDALFNQGRELYTQEKYAASYRTLEKFLQDVEPTQAGKIQEANYYLAANAFYLGHEDAELKLKQYLDTYPYTPFLSQTNFMLGMIYYNKKNFEKAVLYFEEVDEDLLSERERVDFLFHEGYALLETKNYKKALIIFRQLKGMDTRYNAAVLFYNAYAEYCLNNYDAALTDFLKIEENDTYKKIVPYYLVQIYYAKNDIPKVKSYAQRVLAENPNNQNNAEIHRILGEIAYSEGDYAQAITQLKKYEQMYPQVFRKDLFLLGLSYFYTKDDKNAIQYLSKVTTQKDEITENAYLHIGRSYINLGDKENARLAYERATETSFNQSIREEALFNYALTTYETNSAFGESVKAFEQFLAEFPNSKYVDEAYDYLSSVYLTTNNYQAAYESILKIKNPNAKMKETKEYLAYQLGTENFAQGNYDKAIEFFSASLQSSAIGKYSAESYYWRAECYARKKMYVNCTADLNAFFANPQATKSVNYATAHYALGYAYFAQNQFSTALNWFLKYNNAEKNKTGNKQYADAQNRIGDCYFSARNFAKAEEFYNSAVKLDPNIGDYAVFQSGYIDGLQKNYARKIEKMEKLIREYPNSEYADDALYEMGRSYLMLENNNQAILTYQRILTQYPNSDIARKAAVEIGMTYDNMGNTQKAIAAYKNVIETYHGSQEAFTALESLESLYINQNDVNSYLSYTQSLSPNMGKRTVNHADSISYLAAEKRYMAGNYQEAVNGMRDYLNKYCPGGRNCTTARYYLSDSYYRTNESEKALQSFKELLTLGTNEYTEIAVMRCAEITYDLKDYKSSLDYFKQLQEIAQSADNKNVARLGVLRCSYFTNDYQTTINIVNEIVTDPKASEQLIAEAKYNRAKAYIALNNPEKAIDDLKVIAEDTRTSNGAESKYLLANIYYEQNRLADSENEIVDFTKKNTPHQYWLARSLVLLADINIKKGDDFQAKQYLLSLQRNYSREDDIKELIDVRLKAIEEREQSKLKSEE